MVLVTGASRGLGLFCSIAFATRGAKVVPIGRSRYESGLHLPGTVFQTANTINVITGETALPIVCDITEPESIDTMIAKVMDVHGRIDVLMNNASYVLADLPPASEISAVGFAEMLKVNLLGTLQVIQTVIPIMRAQTSGNIINISGKSRTGGSPSDATKAALDVLTTGLAHELRPCGIAVNSLRPSGFIATPGILINSDIRPSDTSSANTYIRAAMLLAGQTAETYSGNIKTDAEVIQDIGDHHEGAPP